MDQLDQRSDHSLATEIGRAFLRAQRLADEIIEDAHRKAAQISQLPLSGEGLIDRATARNAVLMLRELDEVEHKLTSSQEEIKWLLDHYGESAATSSEETAVGEIGEPEPDGVQVESGPADGLVTNDTAAWAVSSPAGLSAETLRSESGVVDADQTWAPPSSEASIAERSVPSAESTVSSESGVVDADQTWAPPSAETSIVEQAAPVAESRPRAPGVDQQWAPPLPTTKHSADPGVEARVSSPAISDLDPVQVAAAKGTGPKHTARKNSALRANLIALVATLVVLSILLVLVNVL